PNPFNPSTLIKYQVPQNTHVNISVYDILGNKISTLVNQEKAAGSYELSFNADNMPSGVYFYTIQTGSFTQTKKMILMK
ncbi:MAG: T9SS type A sorting domain-containing protein, partial [Melioribacteraceae bacterium]